MTVPQCDFCVRPIKNPEKFTSNENDRQELARATTFQEAIEILQNAALDMASLEDLCLHCEVPLPAILIQVTELSQPMDGKERAAEQQQQQQCPQEEGSKAGAVIGRTLGGTLGRIVGRPPPATPVTGKLGYM